MIISQSSIATLILNNDIQLKKTTIIFAAHLGILIMMWDIKKITHNRAGDITRKCIDDNVHFYVSNAGYEKSFLLMKTFMTNLSGTISVHL